MAYLSEFASKIKEQFGCDGLDQETIDSAKEVGKRVYYEKLRYKSVECLQMAKCQMSKGDKKSAKAWLDAHKKFRKLAKEVKNMSTSAFFAKLAQQEKRETMYVLQDIIAKYEKLAGKENPTKEQKQLMQYYSETTKGLYQILSELYQSPQIAEYYRASKLAYDMGGCKIDFNKELHDELTGKARKIEPVVLTEDTKTTLQRLDSLFNKGYDLNDSKSIYHQYCAKYAVALGLQFGVIKGQIQQGEME